MSAGSKAQTAAATKETEAEQTESGPNPPRLPRLRTAQSTRRYSQGPTARAKTKAGTVRRCRPSCSCSPYTTTTSGGCVFVREEKWVRAGSW